MAPGSRFCPRCGADQHAAPTTAKKQTSTGDDSIMDIFGPVLVVGGITLLAGAVIWVISLVAC